MSRPNWWIRFVVDLSTYERVFDKLTTDINRTTVMTQQLLNSKKKPSAVQPHFYNNVLGGFQSEMALIKGMHEDIIDSFSDYKFLKDSSLEGESRKKQKVLGFVGDILSDLFGVVSERDLSSIQNNIKKLYHSHVE